MTVKRINYSGRKKLTRAEANIVIYPPTGEGTAATFEAKLDLSKLALVAANARVFVEAYHRASRLRFDYGTVAAIIEPPINSRRLDQFDDWRHIRFRVKISDVAKSVGRILAMADRIRPQGLDDQDEPDLVRFCDADLDGRLWDIEFDDNGPIVQIERSAGGAQVIGRSDEFRAAAYPEVLRRTLQRAIIEEMASIDDEEHWLSNWFNGFLKPKLNTPAPPVEPISSQIEWINAAVNVFCRKFRLADLWNLKASSRDEAIE